MRRDTIRALGALAATAIAGGTGLGARPARAQAAPSGTGGWPTKPIRLVVPFVAGGSSDIVARSVVQRMQAALGQNVVVENKPGANGGIAAAEVARAPTDGYTFMVGSIGVFAINAALYPKLPYDPAKDLDPLTLAVVTPNVLVAGEKFAARDVRELIAYSKRNPGRLSWASSGTGSSDHLSAELFKLQTDTFGVHIPYRGGAAAMADLIGGNVDVSFQNLGAAIAHIRGGRLKALGVTSERRHPQLPDVPTVIEQGLPGFVVTSWQAFMAPRGLPAPIRGRLHAELVAALNAPEVKERFATQGFEVVGNTPEQYAAFQRDEIERWTKVVKQKGLTPD
ncbi:MAG TPA: tripartite tricarboxylate transporter substrate binding protein [Burkholderiaceae bacterium]|nr:tripartite tricarboxylate transporter substrate binding protein [Burkholderiaceae bacterium]